ncbi:hypothetical protein R4K48_12545 [Brachyspira pulli]|uniref:alginate O-acetyltransferase AlgX-related protein n=1 Tax=Brachyspira pulli TaxID=310721 RepID=UPI0030054625
MGKNKLNKILLIIFIIITILILLLFILGSFKRIGYLNEFKLISSKNGVYSYNFRVNYYSKIFRNSDIYKVYIDTNKIIKENNYIKKIIMNKTGSPFGVLESNIKIEKNIDGIVYTLKPKNIILALPVIFMVILLVSPLLFDLINRLLKINFRNRYAYIVIIFLSFLIMPNIIYKVFYNKFDHTQYEKRKFKEKPKIDLKALDKYPVNYENYFNDNISLKNEFVKLKNIIDIFIFNNLLSSKVLLGEEDWLYFKDGNLTEKYIGVNAYNFSDYELEKAKNILLHFRDELKKRNIKFILMICPDKQFIYPEYMPHYLKRMDIENSTDKFIKYITNNTDIDVVYPKEEILKYKSDYNLYYKYDTHWNKFGAYIGYLELMKEFDIFINFSNFTITNTYRPGDLSYMLSLTNIYYQENDYIVNYKNNFDIIKGSRYHFGSGYCQSDSTNTNNILLIKDSFSVAMFDHIASSFSKSSFVYIDIFKNDEIIKEKPNIVVFQTVERYLKERILYIIPKYKIEEINEN